MADTVCNVQLDTLMPLIRERLGEGQSVRFSPRGTSMLPMLREGIDSIVLSPLPETLKQFDLPLYQREDGKYILHRIIGAGNTYICMGDNQVVPEPGVRREQMIGIVTAFYRGERKHSVTEPAYRLFCRIWYFCLPLRRLWRRGKGWLRRKLR